MRSMQKDEKPPDTRALVDIMETSIKYYQISKYTHLERRKYANDEKWTSELKLHELHKMLKRGLLQLPTLLHHTETITTSLLPSSV